ncbi:hypothetical protein [Streptomyces sp. NPDC096030]|uniref:hypothetical protein n=1 Tax=Streptomyces sp. NPDC096030 TaxID=3155423 RepID=UPI003325330B
MDQHPDGVIIERVTGRYGTALKLRPEAVLAADQLAGGLAGRIPSEQRQEAPGILIPQAPAGAQPAIWSNAMWNSPRVPVMSGTRRPGEGRVR